MKPLVFFSMLMLFAFMAYNIHKWGMLKTFSQYSIKWREWTNEHTAWRNCSPWTVITILTALLIVPPMLEVSDGSAIQFIAFFCPLQLVLVGFTPDHDKNPVQSKWHDIGAGLCSALALAWLLFIAHLWQVVFPVFAVWMFVGYFTKTLQTSFMYYLELTMYLSIYVSLFMLLS